MAVPCNAIFEVRDEVIVYPNDNQKTPSLRTAYFLKLTTTENPTTFSLLDPSLSSEARLTLRFSGWHFPQQGWIEWTERLLSKHRATWESAGILEPILNSTYRIFKSPDLITEIAKKWSPETNTFVFGFGEATVTLEDMAIIAGYPLLGRPVSDAPRTEIFESISKANRLEEERLFLVRTSKSKKANHSVWLKHFTEEDRGSDVEHEAFIAMWLSRFVFPSGGATNTLANSLFPLATKLAEGTMFALGPAVLAEIYRDLTFLRNKLYNVPTSHPYPALRDFADHVPLSSPLQILLVWVWERFPLVQPKMATAAMPWMPRHCHWHNAKRELESEGVRASFVGGDYFIWRPYAKSAMVGHSLLKKWYDESSETRDVDQSSDEAFRSFVRCLRPSELVGLDSFGTIFFERYSPHRVARQFGYDQDLPGFIPRRVNSLVSAWRSYDVADGRDGTVYFPSRFRAGGVTGRYSEWWNGMKLMERMSDDRENRDAHVHSFRVYAKTRLTHENTGIALGTSGSKGKRPRDGLYKKVVLRKVEDLASQRDQFYKNLALRRLNKKDVASGSQSQVPRLEARGPRSCPPGLSLPRKFWGKRDGIEIINLEEDEAPEEPVVRRLEGVTPVQRPFWTYPHGETISVREGKMATTAEELNMQTYLRLPPRSTLKYDESIKSYDKLIGVAREEDLNGKKHLPTPLLITGHGQTTSLGGGQGVTIEGGLTFGHGQKSAQPKSLDVVDEGDIALSGEPLTIKTYFPPPPPGFTRKYGQTTSLKIIDDGVGVTKEKKSTDKTHLPYPLGFTPKYGHGGKSITRQEGLTGDGKIVSREEAVSGEVRLSHPPGFTPKNGRTVSGKSVGGEKSVTRQEGLTGDGKIVTREAARGETRLSHPPGFTPKNGQSASRKSVDGEKSVAIQEGLTGDGKIVTREARSGETYLPHPPGFTPNSVDDGKAVNRELGLPRVIYLPPPPGFIPENVQTTSVKSGDGKTVNREKGLAGASHLPPPRGFITKYGLTKSRKSANDEKNDDQTRLLLPAPESTRQGSACEIQWPGLLGSGEKDDQTTSLKGKDDADDGKGKTNDRGLTIGFWKKWGDDGTGDKWIIGKEESGLGQKEAAKPESADGSLTGDLAGKADTRLVPFAPETTNRRGIKRKAVDEESELLVYIAETGKWCDADELRGGKAPSSSQPSEVDRQRLKGKMKLI